MYVEDLVNEIMQQLDETGLLTPEAEEVAQEIVVAAVAAHAGEVIEE